MPCRAEGKGRARRRGDRVQAPAAGPTDHPRLWGFDRGAAAADRAAVPCGCHSHGHGHGPAAEVAGSGEVPKTPAPHAQGLEPWRKGCRWRCGVGAGQGGEGAHGGALMPRIHLSPSTFDPDLRAPLVTRSLIARPNGARALEAATALPFARRAHDCCRQIHLPVGGHPFLLDLLTPRPGGADESSHAAFVRPSGAGTPRRQSERERAFTGG